MSERSESKNLPQEILRCALDDKEIPEEIMTDIYLVRHGEAEGNLYRRGQGWFNGQITPLGEQQLDCLARRFQDVPLDAVYASDLDRAVQTAMAVARFHPALTVRQDKRLRELHMGVWEDVPWGNIEHADPDMLLWFNNVPEKWIVPEAERFSELLERVRAAVLDIAARHEGQTVAIVSHGMAILTLQRDILARAGGAAAAGHGDNTCVSLLHVEGDDIRAEYLNDTAHLPKELSTFYRQDWWKNEGKGELNNMRIEPLPMPESAALYARCYADAWRSIHGSLEGYDESTYLADAHRHALAAPGTALVQALRGEDFAGLIDLDTQRFARQKIGWISLLYMVPELRGKGLGVQLLGHAVSAYRRLGREVIRLHVSTENPRARRFYEKYRFRQIGETEGAVAPLLLMEMKL